MDDKAFRAWYEEMLVPLKRPGDTVIMGNLPAHKVAGVRQAIEAAGARLLYLQPYSPDFSLIENGFSKFKAHIRKAAARTVEALEEAVANALNIFQPNKRAALFAHAGYDLDQWESALTKTVSNPVGKCRWKNRVNFLRT